MHRIPLLLGGLAIMFGGLQYLWISNTILESLTVGSLHPILFWVVTNHLGEATIETIYRIPLVVYVLIYIFLPYRLSTGL